MTLGNAMFIGFVLSLVLDNTVKGKSHDIVYLLIVKGKSHDIVYL